MRIRHLPAPVGIALAATMPCAAGELVRLEGEDGEADVEKKVRAGGRRGVPALPAITSARAR